MVAHIGRQTMNDWQSTYLGRGVVPPDSSGFQIEAFFTYSESLSGGTLTTNDEGDPASRIRRPPQMS